MTEASLKTKKRQIRTTTTNFDKFLNTIKSADQVRVLCLRYDNFKPLLKQFIEAQDQLELLTIENDADPAEPDENERFEYENRYYELCSKAEELIDKFTIKASSSSTDIKLPTIELPHFDGEYTSWTAFYDSFRTLIHENTNLEKIQKLHYLRSCLGDEPKRIIDNLSISAQSYDTAWRLLKERYHSKRLIVHNHIHGLFNLTQVNKSPNSLRTLLDQLNANLESLKAQNLDVTNWDPVLIYLVSTKFDFATKREWESKLKNNELPTLKEMTTFISQRCQTLESMEFCNSFEVNSENPRYNFTKSKFPEVKRKLTICPKCKQSSHCFVQQCTAFLQLSIQDRINEVKRLKLCLNCLREGHDARSCTSRYCRTCNGRHHTLLHLQKREPQSVNNHSCSTEFKSLTLLSTAVIKIRDGNGQLHKVRALLDIGSDSNFITDKLCRLLKLNLNKCQVSIAGIGQTSTTLTRAAKVFIKSICDNYSNTISCLVLPEITNNLPVETFDPTPLRIPDNLTLADPEFYISGEIDLLIGAGLFYDILREGRIKLQNNITYVQNSCFGWLVGGPYTNVGLQCQGPRENSCLLSTNSLEHQMSKFWELEGMDNNVNFTTDDEACEISFVTTTKRDPDGRFLVALPVKTRPLDIGQSKRTAINQFKSLEGKFGRNHGLRDEYNKFLGEYLALNHMERVTVPDDPSIQCVYLPHHPVIKETSLTTKTRVVFNASSRTSNGQSLNDNLMTGPNLQADLFSIIVRCRLHKYVLSADLSKMFRQIWVRPEDRDLLRIAYRFDQTEPIQVFRLKTVTYGLNCAPFLAMRCLRELAYEASADYPQAAKTILNSFYMDDLLVGVDNVDEGIKLRDDLNNILKGGGFELYKWASNETKLLPNQDSENNTAVVRLDSNFETKALGLTWNCQRDLFKYQLAAIKLPKVATKRNVLSIIAKIFDPLGLLSPMLIVAKILLQKLWQLKLNWDEPIPSELSETFHHFCANLHRIDEFVIPRCINYFSPQILELHGFCDTSKEAYGAAIYVVAVGENKQRQINLLCSKSRVAPLKPTTIPRLELCAAVLLAKLTVKIINTLDICVGKIYLWSDSMITLSWIAAEPKRWEPFVAHRVAAIQEMTKREQWHYVNSQQNPADIITRGMCPSDREKFIIWFHGPAFLLKDSSHWPKPPSHVTELPPERRNVTLVSQTQPDLNVFHRVSTYKKLKRVLAYCYRFIHNCTHKTDKLTGELKLNELQTAEKYIIKFIQKQEFGQEISDLKNKHVLSKRSKLTPLNVFLDENEILRVGGRLRNANLDFKAKHQVVLPKSHIITKLIIRDTHGDTLHGGPQATLAAVRQLFWPLSGRSIVRKIIHNCIRCQRVKPISYEQLMGNLPADRVSPARPFQNCGIDYCGPILIKESPGRGKRNFKAYIAVFVCLATKAVHLELVRDYSAQCFLNALKRMMARRGKVAHMYSDNGSNFVGGYRELQDLKRLLESTVFQKRVVSNLADEGVTWKFIPPNSPYVGGIWEAAVKSFKYHFKRVAGTTVLTVEEMSTLLTLIEAILNSRPLVPMSNDPDDLDPLTSGHFLIGTSLTAPPEPSLLHLPENRLSRWQRVEQLRQLFWERWTREYLTSLQTRTKWRRENPIPLQVGAMVVLKNENIAPLQWKLGRIVELHPGSDNIVRVVTVKTGTGVTKRAVNRLCVLPMEDSAVTV